VIWHAVADAKDETGRAVYIAKSTDNGKTFGRERMANPEPTGACGCCALRATVDGEGTLYVLYRSAEQKVNRDTMVLVSRNKGESFQESLVDRWNINACPMSMYSLASGAAGVVGAWETTGSVLHATLKRGDVMFSRAVRESGQDQKHPTVVQNARGETLVAWTEGTGWQKGGSLAWQVYDSAGRRTTAAGRVPGIPVWGLATAFVGPDDNFVIVY
jgi:hypothetical protein